MTRLDELLGQPVSMRSLALLRALMGPIVLLHLRPFLADSLHGHIYRDAFYEPYASWYPELPRALYIGLLWLGAVAAVAMTVGILTRLATATTFAVVAYNLFLSTTHFHNNRAYLLIVLGVLTLVPAGWDVRAPAWPLWLLRFECSAVYAASGISKLLDPDWFSGTVPWMRVVESRQDLDVLPGWVISILTDRDFHTIAAKFVIGTELFIAAGLWWRRSRYAAVWVAVIFHVTIQASAAIEIFSVLGIAVLVIWATPSTRDRLVRVDPRRHGLVRRLDWLARFRIEPAERLQVVDRDGSVRSGAPAVAFVLSRLPLTAWFALPFTTRRRLSR